MAIHLFVAKFFNRKTSENKKIDFSNSIAKSTIAVFIAIVLAKFCAFLEDAVVASLIGTSTLADSYYISADIIQLFWYFGTLGIVRVFLPEYKSQLTRYGRLSAERYSNSMFGFFTLFSLFITCFILLFSAPLSGVIAFGFSAEQQSVTAYYVRMRTPQIVFWCWTSLLTAKLQSHNRFFVSKLPEILTHIPVIIFSIVLYQVYGIRSLFFGLLAGSILGFISQLCFLKKDLLPFPRLCLNDRGVVVSFKRIPAAFLSAALTQIHSMVDKVMASAQPTGAVSSLSYGHKMYTAVNGLIIVAISTVIYPKITELAAKTNSEKIGELLRDILLVLSFLIIPFSIGFCLFSPELTTILFMRGAFAEQSVSQVSIIFSSYVAGLFFAGVSNIIQLVYFAYGNTKTPMYISLIGIIFNIILNFVLMTLWGVVGIALASSIAALITSICFIARVKTYVAIANKAYLLRIVRLALAALFSCLSAYFATNLLFPNASEIARLTVGFTIGSPIYLLLVFIFDKKVFSKLKM